MTTAPGIPEAWPILLTREQLCAYLGGLSDATVRKICPVPAVDLGANVLRYHRAAIDAWVDSLGPRGLKLTAEGEQDAAGPAAANDTRAAMTPAQRARARATRGQRWKRSNTSSVSKKAG